MRIDLIAGARPNFMKIAPIIEAIQKNQTLGSDLTYRLIHTGQHYDKNMSASFFEQLNIPEPDIHLESGGGTQAELTAKIMLAYEKLLMKESADLCLVVGDVTSTLACSVVAKKMGLKVAHVEAGIRSFDMSMPEEINRMVTDSISDYYFTTSQTANQLLKSIGAKEEHIFFVGNTMIDTLLKQEPNFYPPDFWNEKGLVAQKYLVLTLHRPANVDHPEVLRKLLATVVQHAEDYPIVFPVHPRTRKVLQDADISFKQILETEPLPYLEFNYLVKNALAVITDSGGITEETTVMGIPCMTLRDNTERPETVSMGTNELLGTNPSAIPPALNTLFSGNWKSGNIPPLWDGKAASRIVDILKQLNFK